MSMCLYVCSRVRGYVWALVCVRVCECVCLWLHLYVRLFVCTCVCVYVSVRVQSFSTGCLAANHPENSNKIGKKGGISIVSFALFRNMSRADVLLLQVVAGVLSFGLLDRNCCFWGPVKYAVIKSYHFYRIGCLPNMQNLRIYTLCITWSRVIHVYIICVHVFLTACHIGVHTHVHVCISIHVCTTLQFVLSIWK